MNFGIFSTEKSYLMAINSTDESLFVMFNIIHRMTEYPRHILSVHLHVKIIRLKVRGIKEESL